MRFKRDVEQWMSLLSNDSDRQYEKLFVKGTALVLIDLAVMVERILTRLRTIWLVKEDQHRAVADSRFCNPNDASLDVHDTFVVSCMAIRTPHYQTLLYNTDVHFLCQWH